jgi:hypothetical protein
VVNQQETTRMGGDSRIDDRTLRELYLLPFEIAVERAIGEPQQMCLLRSIPLASCHLRLLLCHFLCFSLAHISPGTPSLQQRTEPFMRLRDWVF